jgi:DNA-binding transcriptional MerR regulator
MLIGEVARHSGVTTRMLRHYDTLGLVRPTGRTTGNYREYTPDDIRRIFHVESLRTLGLSLRQIARALQDPDFTPTGLVHDLIQQTEQRLHQQQELLDRLHAVDATTPGDWHDVLRIVELLHGLHSPSPARRQQTALAAPTATTGALTEAALTETDPHVAGALRWALARAGDDAVTTLAPALNSTHPATRRRAVQALAEIPGDHATTLLTDALNDPDPAVRRHAALAAGARGATTATPTLIAMIIEGANDVEAAETLATLTTDPDHTDQIITTLTAALAAPTADPATRLRLTQALAEMPAPAAHPTLRNLTHDHDRAVALLAATLLPAGGEAHPPPP